MLLSKESETQANLYFQIKAWNDHRPRCCCALRWEKQIYRKETGLQLTVSGAQKVVQRCWTYQRRCSQYPEPDTWHPNAAHWYAWLCLKLFSSLLPHSSHPAWSQIWASTADRIACIHVWSTLFCNLLLLGESPWQPVMTVWEFLDPGHFLYASNTVHCFKLAACVGDKVTAGQIIEIWLPF